MRLHTRTYPLDDIQVDKSGDGRTVTAYATVFDALAEVRDQDGHYNEQIARAAFDKTIAERGTRVGVFYNHGLTLHGTPSERASVPLGTPLEIRADGKGLLTRTRYNRTQMADDVLESINNGDIRGQSFTGRMIQSDPARGPFRARSGKLTTVTRKEIGLTEYGPTPLPVYVGAEIVGVRAQHHDLIERLRNVGGIDLDELVDLDDEQLLEAVRAATRTGGPADETTTPDGGAGATGEPAPEEGDHSRPARRAQEVRARLRKIGALT